MGESSSQSQVKGEGPQQGQWKRRFCFNSRGGNGQHLVEARGKKNKAQGRIKTMSKERQRVVGGLQS